MDLWHRVTGSLASACALALVAGCAGAPRPEARSGPVLPALDLCAEIDRQAVAAALHGAVERCTRTAEADGPDMVTFAFTGTARLPAGRSPAELAVTYCLRRDPRTGADLWESVRPGDDDARVSVLGLGDAAVFEAAATAPRPQLMAVKGGLLIGVGLNVTGRAVPRAQLPDHLIEIGRQVFAAAG